MVSDRRGFGERLKRQRERAGITLAAISQTTKVPVALFTGLEAGDCSRWPAALFARAYVRGYAEAIGLNPDETVEEFGVAFQMTLKAEVPEAAPLLSSGIPGGLRLAMVEDSLSLATFGRRAGFAASELVLSALIAVVARIGLGASFRVTIGLVIGYFVVGRLLSDDPLLYWAFKRLRHQPPAAAAPADAQSPEVSPVADTASTVA